MRKLGTNRLAAWLVVAAISVLLSACGGNGPLPPLALQITAVDIPPGGGDETVTWTVEWEGGTPPYTIGINLGGGAQSDLPAGTAAISPFQAQFTLTSTSFDISEYYSYVVVVTDAAGTSAVAQDVYEVGPTEPPHLAWLDLTYDADSGLLRVVADPDWWGSLQASITLPAGMVADAASRWMDISAGEAVAEFYVYAEDVLAGAAGQIEVKVEDPNLVYIGYLLQSLEVTIDPIALGEGALAAIPQRRHVTADQTALVVVACGDFPADKPFQYLNGVGVTVDQGAEYVVNSLNYGTRGGLRADRDGIWVDVACVSFLEGDILIQENDIGGGRVRIDFNVTPIGGHEVTTGGALLNLALSFSEPGTYTLGFEEFHDVKRTYYSDGEADGETTEFYWADISNDYPGVPNSIIVVAP